MELELSSELLRQIQAHGEAAYPENGAFLLQHLSPMNTRKYGIRIKEDGVLNGKHTLFLIMEANSAEQVEEFMQPFKMAGPVEVWPASDCEEVVARAGC